MFYIREYDKLRKKSVSLKPIYFFYPIFYHRRHMQKRQSYIFSADVIRVLAISGVVLIHTANAVYARLDFFGGLSWWIALFLDSLSRISIPLFILLSGFLLLGRKESFRSSIKRAGSRIGIPLIFWTLFYMWWGSGKPSFTNINLKFFLLLLSGGDFHLYFLFIVIGLYLASSFISSYITTQKKLLFLLVFFFLALGVVEVAGEYIFGLCGSENAFTMWVPFVGLFIGGYVLPHAKEMVKKTPLLISLYSIGLLMTLGWNYLYFLFLSKGQVLFYPHNCLSQYSDYYLSINVVIMSVSAFIILVNMSYAWIKSILVRRLIHLVSKASFAIYLIHVFLIEAADKIHLFDKITPAWAYVGIKWGTILFISSLIALLLIKIPFINRLIGEK